MTGQHGGGRPVRRLAGTEAGRLLVIEQAPRPSRASQPGAWWRCRCACGIESVVHGDALAKGRTRSCGCLRRETSAARGRRMLAVGRDPR